MGFLILLVLLYTELEMNRVHVYTKVRGIISTYRRTNHSNIVNANSFVTGGLTRHAPNCTIGHAYVPRWKSR